MVKRREGCAYFPCISLSNWTKMTSAPNHCLAALSQDYGSLASLLSLVKLFMEK